MANINKRREFDDILKNCGDTVHVLTRSTSTQSRTVSVYVVNGGEIINVTGFMRVIILDQETRGLSTMKISGRGMAATDIVAPALSSAFGREIKAVEME